MPALLRSSRPQPAFQAVAQTTVRAPRVLLVIPGEPIGSSMIFARRQAANVAQAGVVTQTFYLRSRTSPVALLKEWYRLRQEIRSFQPDLLHAHFGTMTGFLSAIATSRPLVITYRGSDLNPCPSVSWLRSASGKLLSQLAALRATHIICVSRQLENRLWWRKRVASVFPSGVETDLFYPRAAAATRRELGWIDDERVVVFNAGKNPTVKRLDLARRAFEVTVRLCPRARLEVLDGDVPPDLVPAVLNAADCLLVTSDWEGSPTIVQEALACNLPIVSVEVGDIRDRLAGVEHCFVVARDPQELGRTVATVLDSPRRTNGEHKIDAISAQRIAAQIIAIYEEIAGRRCSHR